jgi:hypothetical protein
MPDLSCDLSTIALAWVATSSVAALLIAQVLRH